MCLLSRFHRKITPHIKDSVKVLMHEGGGRIVDVDVRQTTRNECKALNLFTRYESSCVLTRQAERRGRKAGQAGREIITTNPVLVQSGKALFTAASVLGRFFLFFLLLLLSHSVIHIRWSCNSFGKSFLVHQPSFLAAANKVSVAHVS